MNISPLGQRPTEFVLLDEPSRLVDNPPTLWVEIRPLADDVNVPIIKVLVDGVPDVDGWRADRLGISQVRLRIGATALPIAYLIRIQGEFAIGTEVTTDYSTYQVGSWSYFVSLQNLHCIDESNELSDSDEIQVAAMTTVDATCFIKCTREYEDIDAGGDYSFDVKDKFLQSSGGAVEVFSLLGLELRLYEIDKRPIDVDRTQEQDGAARLALALGTLGNDHAALAGAVVLILGEVLKAAVRVDDSNYLGSQSRTWSPQQLLELTRTAEQSFDEELLFSNPDSEGSHRVTVRITRV